MKLYLLILSRNLKHFTHQTIRKNLAHPVGNFSPSEKQWVTGGRANETSP